MVTARRGRRPAVDADGATSAPGPSTGADQHAVLVTSHGIFTPSISRITSRPVTSVTALGKMLTWLATYSRDPKTAYGLRPAGRCGQVWIISPDTLDALGWLVDPGEIAETEDDRTEADREVRARVAQALTDAIATTLPELAAAGWVLRGGDDRQYGHRLNLVQVRADDDADTGRASTPPLMVDVMIAPYAWTMQVRARLEAEELGVLGRGDAETGTGLPDDEYAATVELGRRLAWCVDHLGTLPGGTSADTGAAVYDKIMRERRGRTTKPAKGAEGGTPRLMLGAVDTAGPLPPLDDAPVGDIEPGFRWAPEKVTQDHTDPAVDPATGALRLVHIDQEAAYLASMSMVSLGYGPVRQLTGVEAFKALAAKPVPFGVWQITAPALAELPDYDVRMPPHPRWTDHAAPSTFWVTTEGLAGLGGILSPVDKGGTGLTLEAFTVHQGWVTAEAGRHLEPWAKTVAAAYKYASGRRPAEAPAGEIDTAMRDFTKAIYRGYVGRMANPKLWADEHMAHHHQRMWYETIHAHATNRTRRKAAAIHAATGLHPLRVVVDALVYAVPPGVEIADAADGLLGRMRPKHDIMVPGPETAADGMGWIALLAATDRKGVAATVDKALAGTLGQREDR